MGLFERHLSVWIALAIVFGVGLGVWFPDAAASIAALETAGINLPIAVLIWGMIFPMMLAVDFSFIGAIRQQPRGLGFLLSANRLNVAMSRAQCLSIVVGSPTLAAGSANNVEEAEQLNSLCRIIQASRT
ncbi:MULTISPECIES: arsenic resistance protein [unclassified Synechococcus]|uniref:arsenic resistance protein n=1 Tax=unclassified Synechococcus TaxID=2626047 RepID=UPI002000EED4|nr:hypothetical protein [Synechococcus sp. A10-1-5-1]UPM49507.1 hypothetical protein MY494_09170 [Synechococcus sp. A10-1-5-1]